MLRKEGARTRLRIRFGAGERPHLFWVERSPPSGACLRVLSKRRADGHLEVVITRDDHGAARHALGELELGPETPAGWLDRWVEAFAEELGSSLERFDLRHVESVEEWRSVATRLGWQADGERSR